MDDPTSRAAKQSSAPQKLQFKLDGLAAECEFEQSEEREVELVDEINGTRRIVSRQRHYFTVRLVGPSLVLNFVLKLPMQSTWQLDSLLVERSVDGEIFDTLVVDEEDVIFRRACDASDNKPRKRAVPVGKAARALRFALYDLEEKDPVLSNVLGVNVIGFSRGANPNPSRLRVLLDTATEVAYIGGGNMDRAEVGALCGVALMNAKRFQQAAEVLRHAATEASIAMRVFPSVATEVQHFGEQLLLLSVRSLLQCRPLLPPEGLTDLVNAASFANHSHDDVARPNGIIDSKTLLTSVSSQLAKILVLTIEASESTVVRLAAVKIMDYMFLELGCGVGASLLDMLACVLANYKFVATGGTPNMVQVSLEEAFASTVNTCCSLLPVFDHRLLLQLFESILVPILGNTDLRRLLMQADIAGGLACTAFAQQLRVLYVVLTCLKGDVSVSDSLVTLLFNAAKFQPAEKRLPQNVRQAAMVCWKAVKNVLAVSVTRCEANEFGSTLLLFKDLLQSELEARSRSEEDAKLGVLPKEVQLNYRNGEDSRVCITDISAVRRVLDMAFECTSALAPARSSNDAGVEAILEVHNGIFGMIENLTRSMLIDIAHQEARRAHEGTPAEAFQTTNNNREHGDGEFKQLLQVLSDLWKLLWLTTRLLPHDLRNSRMNGDLMEDVLMLATERLRDRAPPVGFLELLLVLVRSRSDFLSASIAPSKTLALLLEALAPWVTQTPFIVVFDLLDVLIEQIGRRVRPQTMIQLVHAATDQSTEAAQARAEKFLAMLATFVVQTTSERPVEMLQEHYHYLCQFGIKNAQTMFPFNGLNLFKDKSHASLQVDAASVPALLHVHVSVGLIAFSEEALGRSSNKMHLGPRLSATGVDEFLQNAAMAERCLEACSHQAHEEHKAYITSMIGTIFRVCLIMNNHADSRVRSVGLDIFTSALDISFYKSATEDNGDDGDAKEGATVPQDFSGRFTGYVESATGALDKQERCWDFLFKYLTTTIGVGAYNDLIVQRSCLLYVREVLIGAMLGLRMGASVIGMEHVEQAWGAVSRLNGSPWRSLSTLSFAMYCILLNVAFYCTLCGRSRGSRRMRWKHLESFVVDHVFPQITLCLVGSTYDERLWAVRLTEVYLRLREMNSAGRWAPPPPPEIWDAISVLKMDWNDEVAVTAGSLRIFSLGSDGQRGRDNSEGVAELWMCTMSEEVFAGEETLERDHEAKTLEAFLEEAFEPEMTELDLVMEPKSEPEPKQARMTPEAQLAAEPPDGIESASFASGASIEEKLEQSAMAIEVNLQTKIGKEAISRGDDDVVLPGMETPTGDVLNGLLPKVDDDVRDMLKNLTVDDNDVVLQQFGLDSKSATTSPVPVSDLIVDTGRPIGGTNGDSSPGENRAD